MSGWEPTDCGWTKPRRRSRGSAPVSSWSRLTSTTSWCCRPPSRSSRLRATASYPRQPTDTIGARRSALSGRVLPAAATTPARPVDDGMEAARTVAAASISLDHCNSLLYGLPDTLLSKLRSVWNATARLITDRRRRDHITPVLRELHWLWSIRVFWERVKFKVACLVGLPFGVRAGASLLGR